MSVSNNDEEWKHVTRKKGRLRHVLAPAECDDSATVVSSNPRPSLTSDDIRLVHMRVESEWRASSCYEALQKLLAEKKHDLPDVSKAICLGIGSFDPSNGSWRAKRTAHTQLEAFLTMAHALGTRRRSYGNPADGPADHVARRISLVVQEPAFTAADKQFCESLGFRVVDDAKVDAHTLVFGIHLYHQTWRQVLGGGVLPAVFVGTACEAWQAVASAPRLEPMTRMEAEYAKCVFPDVEYMFSDTCVYWRPTEDGIRGRDGEAKV